MKPILTKTLSVSSSLLLAFALVGSASAAPVSIGSQVIIEKVREVPTPEYPRDPRHARHHRPIEVDIWTDRGDGASYRVGDPIRIYFQTSIDAFVTIYDLDTRGRVNVLFPSRYSGDNFVRGGRTYSLPANGAYHLAVQGPRGVEYLRAVASTDPDYRLGYGEPTLLLAPELGRELLMTPSGFDRAINKLVVEIPSRPESVAVAETSFYVRQSYWSRPRHPSRYPGRHR